MRSDSVSSSTSSSRRSSIDSEPVQLFIRKVSGDTFPLTVPASTSISTLQSLLAIRTNLPESDLRLVYAGKHLNPSETLSTYSIGHESTIGLLLPLRGGAPKKIRCGYKDCKDAAQRISGDCGFCNGHYCNKHRMLESHACSGLEDCKREEKQRNGEKLLNERTVAIKGI